MTLPKVTVYYKAKRFEPQNGKYEGDVGIDIQADINQSAIILPGHGMWIPGGFDIQFGSGWMGLVLPRSSTNRMGLLVFTGVIDNGYAGNIGAQVQNVTYDPIVIEPAQRIAQLVVLPGWSPDLVPVARFRPTDRGDAGWGSSGS